MAVEIQQCPSWLWRSSSDPSSVHHGCGDPAVSSSVHHGCGDPTLSISVHHDCGDPAVSIMCPAWLWRSSSDPSSVHHGCGDPAVSIMAVEIQQCPAQCPSWLWRSSMIHPVSTAGSYRCHVSQGRAGPTPPGLVLGSPAMPPMSHSKTRPTLMFTVTILEKPGCWESRFLLLFCWMCGVLWHRLPLGVSASVCRLTQGQDLHFHWERERNPHSRQEQTLTSTPGPGSSAVVSLCQRLVVLFSSLLAPTAHVPVAGDRQMFAIIWIEATYPPGAKCWECLALFASDISIPPVGRGSFRSQNGIFFALTANWTQGLVRRGHLP
ncbi:uncharacterized protein LOC131587739 [Poecile atricapillus]|uniref:uncharacterized protein LOC131587739 n=1 Tax=Poecile atricapillus TaxID=48891 RepID=UPI002738C8E9|nr:uncharacterized protein LOC131587739 [Poecile atricapillus]